MAARLNPKHQQSVRDKIKAGRHIEELAKCSLGEREMDANQIRAACFLIEQSIGKAPQSVELDSDGTLTIKVMQYGSSDTK